MTKDSGLNRRNGLRGNQRSYDPPPLLKEAEEERTLTDKKLKAILEKIGFV